MQQRKRAAPGRQTQAAAPAALFPVVGIGASAGGLGAFEAFFSGMPAEGDPGMAFVLVQHLAPDHKSILSGLIQRHTRMQVMEAEDGMVVRPNCAYIIPPNRDMAFLNGALQLLEPVAPRGQRLPIDFLFRSLALDQRERAICIVLSGTGSDGTLGLRAIKGEGGMVMAQSPESTEYDGMPRSAIATGLVDFQLPPAQMPAQLLAYVARAMAYPATAAPPAAHESTLRKLFVLLRAQTGHDFSQYKVSTVHRRIERRMAVQQIATLDGYLRFAQQTPAELDALFRDLLIGVTSFFRDSEAFRALEEQTLPRLFVDRPPGAAIRVWSAGCSTGEEAYSIAILLQERLEILKQSFPVQVFATDIDAQSIAAARAGLYPASIAMDLSPERLARFFTLEPDASAYRIHKSIRDMLVFSEQDLVRDPPFSRLDLVVCRNVLIYMGNDLQKKLLPLFHYALAPGGVLFMGTSESVGDFTDLFTVVDRKNKLYQRAEDLQVLQHPAVSRSLPAPTGPEDAAARAPNKAGGPVRQPLRELTEQALLQHAVPAAALVNDQGDILYLHGRTGMFLEPAPGETGTSNILKMAREGLRRELAVALHRAAGARIPVAGRGLRVKTNGHFTAVDFGIFPVPVKAPGKAALQLYLVTLAESAAGAEARDPLAEAAGPAGDAQLDDLRRELRAKEEYLQTANEELETSNEELKSSNEEMQSVNEELQSTNEELETSKEELQSVNEELATVNAELQTKVADLSRANNDMNNLLAGTGIATVFVDRQLRLVRFTPAATRIINLILGDLGRPVGHVLSNIENYSTLVADSQQVLDTLIPKEVDVCTADGRWYSLRIQPYRTLDSVIEGAVLTFVDITERKAARKAMDLAAELHHLAGMVRDSRDAVTVLDLEGRIAAWNPGAERLYGWSEAQALAMNLRDRVPAGQRRTALARVIARAQGERLEPLRMTMVRSDGSTLAATLVCTPLVDGSGRIYAIATTERATAPAAP